MSYAAVFKYNEIERQKSRLVSFNKTSSICVVLIQLSIQTLTPPQACRRISLSLNPPRGRTNKEWSIHHPHRQQERSPSQRHLPRQSFPPLHPRHHQRSNEKESKVRNPCEKEHEANENKMPPNNYSSRSCYIGAQSSEFLAP